MSKYLIYVLLVVGTFCCPDIYGQTDDQTMDTSIQVFVDYSESQLIDFEQATIESNIQQKLEKPTDSWIFFLLFFCTGLYAYLKYVHGREWDASFRAISNMNISQQLYRDREITQSIASILLNANYTIVLSIYVYLLFEHFVPDFSAGEFSVMITVLVLVALILGFRFFTLRLFSLIFPVSDAVDYYSYNLLLINKITGMVLLPMLFIIEFGNDLLFGVGLVASMLVVLLSIFYKIYRGMIIANSFIKVQKFHFILYICTLEISPVLILIKLVMLNLGGNLV